VLSSTTTASEQHRLGLRVVHHHGHHDRARGGERSGRRVHQRAGSARFLLRLGADVAHVHGVAAIEQVARHAHAHRADADDAHCGSGHAITSTHDPS
jgi:hypothetical protein